ncbi:MAG: hypothetical protein CO035_07500 [Candidatus Omnitrophica bacterium CG_4_9_14_0_2_um_filter_42_8]|nr:MAG: hypothetical protein COW92_03515 [Candidatus Omnitrophica bacterium CG22_combo_CG10-13_8_21_14_all_43_16]PJC47088.1 MAG: hypothetical protein CO035_07500 [Candidatus Omnitrophica bacterium CG_4_9_14_0_2_um_filter_42_8]
MDFICPVCNKNLPREILVIIPHTEEHIVDEIKKQHPDWSAEDGICEKCYRYYKEQMGHK